MKTRSFVVAAVICTAGVLIMTGASWAEVQTDPGIAFDRTLETLRQSVAGLVKENQAINAENIATRVKIKALQEGLRSLQAESQRLEVKKAAEVQKTQNRSSGVDVFKAQAAAADVVVKQVRDEVEVERAALKDFENEESALQQKADALSADIAAMNVPGSSSEEVKKELVSLKTEQNVLQQQLSDVLLKVQDAKQQWQQANAVVSVGPVQLDALKTERDTLVKALPQVEADLAGLGARLSEMQGVLDRLHSEDYSDTRAGRLDSEVKDMAERNRKLESEILTTTKTQEEKLKRFKEDQEKMRKQCQDQQEQLSKRNADLKVELDTLRKQMVDLDKKKSALEGLIYPAR